MIFLSKKAIFFARLSSFEHKTRQFFLIFLQIFPRLPHHLHPCKSLPLIFIVEIILHSVCLTLEGKGIICLHETAKSHKMIHPFHDIPEVKADEKHLLLLQRMYILMILCRLGQASHIHPTKHIAEQIDSPERAKREIFVVDDPHIFKL